MNCIELMSQALAAFLATACWGAAAVLVACMRGFTMTKLGALGLEVELKEPITFHGPRSLKWPAIVSGAVGSVLWVLTGLAIANPPGLPGKYSDVCSADIQLSGVDDEMRVLVNNVLVASATYEDNLGRIGIKEYLRKGTNRVEVQVDNRLYGGCGGQMIVRFNGHTAYTWAQFARENKPARASCFYETFSLILE